ncbi:MAG: phosphatase PAP2 family protein [Candidatus Roizmanbacteria bacterium]|nr:MAG: phosphatase PAP2 family protein [Candidatus Roizmanbacteria bacterium]
MITLIANIDRGITAFLYNFFPHNQFFDYIFSFFSFYGSSIIIWFIAALLLVIFAEKKNKKFIIYLAVALLITLFLTNVVFKNVFHRVRPVQTPNTSISCPKDFSFPSGHASAAFAGAVVLAVFDKKRKYFYYGTAILIAYSRIYLGCHYFLDVLGGSIVGSIVAYLTLRFGQIFLDCFRGCTTKNSS